MSAPATRLQSKRTPQLPDHQNAETRFWKQLRAPLLIKENNAVSHIHFAPIKPHDLAFTSSNRIQILNSKTQQVVKTFNKFKDTVYSGEFRSDGRLLVAGDATGHIQCFDTTTKSVLVNLKPTSHPVHVTKFDPKNNSILLTASDDRCVRLFDLTSSEPLFELKNQHQDYIRTANFFGNQNLIITGCYDNKVKLFDKRQQSCVVEYDMHTPVESVIPINETLIGSCGGNEVLIYDVVAGKTYKKLHNFQKTVTCLSKVGSTNNFLASSLDGHVKLFDGTNLNFNVSFGWRYGGPVLATMMSPDLNQLATGLTTGLLSVRTRKADKINTNSVKKVRTETMSRVMRGMDFKGELESQVIRISNKPRTALKLKQFEKHIKSFRWFDALDSAFKPQVSLEQQLMVLYELRDRGKLLISLQNRDEAQLEPLVRWCVKYICDPRHVSLVSDWVNGVVELHPAVISKSEVLMGLVEQLSVRVRGEVARAKDAQSMEGMLELLMA